MRSLAILVACVMLVGCETEAAKTAKKPATVNAIDNIKKIAAHDWWKKKPNEKQVEAICKKVVGMTAGKVLIIQGDGTFLTGTNADVPVNHRGERVNTDTTDYLFFYLDPSQPSHYTTCEVADEVLQKLDKAKYQGR